MTGSQSTGSGKSSPPGTSGTSSTLTGRKAWGKPAARCLTPLAKPAPRLRIIEHLRDLVERVLDPEPAGFRPMPARASDAARDEALTEEARAIQSGLIALAKEAEEFSSVLDLARENREPVPLSQWRVVRPAFNIESVYPKTGSRWVLVLGGSMIDPDDLKRLIQELVVADQKAKAAGGAAQMFKEQTGAEPEGAALGNAFKSYRLGESPHLLLECASVQAAWFMQQHYDQSVAARLVNGVKVYSLMTFKQLPGAKDALKITEGDHDRSVPPPESRSSAQAASSGQTLTAAEPYRRRRRKGSLRRVAVAATAPRLTALQRRPRGPGEKPMSRLKSRES